MTDWMSGCAPLLLTMAWPLRWSRRMTAVTVLAVAATTLITSGTAPS